MKNALRVDEYFTGLHGMAVDMEPNSTKNPVLAKMVTNFLKKSLRSSNDNNM